MDRELPLPLSIDAGRRLAATDADALEGTLERLAPGLLRYCLARSATRPRAEDTAQDAMAALVDRWRRHGPPDDPRAFVFAVARRRAARAGLRARLRRSLEGLGLVAGERDPETAAAVHQRRRRLLRAIEELPPGEGEAVRLVVLGELSIRAAAAALGIGESAVKMRLARGRAKLGRWLQEEDGDA